jgi:uncharacterized protein YyaL (SSP411 family)
MLFFLACCGGMLAAQEAPRAPVPAVRWQPWGPEAFAEARAKDRPIALYIEARWNHLDQVFQADVLGDTEVATLLNEEFIPVRVDRERRPDVDVRYQEAVRALTGAGGWPLSVFLTPDGEALVGGALHELEDDYVRERPGFRTVIRHVLANWRKNRDEVRKKAREFEAALREKSAEAPKPAPPPAEVLAKVAEAARVAFSVPRDHDSPRFPQPLACEVLLADDARNGRAPGAGRAKAYLSVLLNGAIYDHVGGGFHRCTQDSRWRRPRFEKLLAVNAEMLGLCVRMLEADPADESVRRAGLGALRWIVETMSDVERGGFYASQAASTGPRDPGLYYTWTVGEVEKVLTDDKVCRIACALYDIGERGELLETAPHRNVLFPALNPADVAAKFGMEKTQAAELGEQVRALLRTARAERPAPRVDRAILVDANARMVSAYLAAAATLGEKGTVGLDRQELGAFALRTLDRLLKEAVDPQRGAAHVIEPDGTVLYLGLASDEAALALTCQDAYLATGQARYLEAADAALARLDERFRDPADGAYWDRAPKAPGAPEALGRLSDPHKPVTDTPGPSVNGMAALAHLRQGALTGETRHADAARKTLETFGPVLEGLGPGAAMLTLAADAAQRGFVIVLVEGAADQARTGELLACAAQTYVPHKLVLRVELGDRATLERFGAKPGAAEGQPVAHVLVAGKESETRATKELAALLRSAAKQ